MLELDPKYRPLLLEALEELLYKLSLQLEELKGGQMTKEREALSRKQRQIEKLQHEIFQAGDT